MQALTYLVMVHNNACSRLYDKLIKNGVCEEYARSVLPQNTYVQYYGTTNLKNLVNFADRTLRDLSQRELQLVARACLKLSESFFPEEIRSYINSMSVQDG